MPPTRETRRKFLQFLAASPLLAGAFPLAGLARVGCACHRQSSRGDSGYGSDWDRGAARSSGPGCFWVWRRKYTADCLRGCSGLSLRAFGCRRVTQNTRPDIGSGLDADRRDRRLLDG